MVTSTAALAAKVAEISQEILWRYSARLDETTTMTVR
jgi:hypothetical protein